MLGDLCDLSCEAMTQHKTQWPIVRSVQDVVTIIEQREDITHD